MFRLKSLVLKNVTLALSVGSLFLLSACSSEEESITGPCVVLPGEPVLKITSATNESNQQAISQIQLSNISIAGVEQDFDENHFVISENIEFDYEQDILTCTVPCGIGSTEGDWEFTVSATGFQDKVENVYASYAVYNGGCPGIYSGGTEVDVVLRAVTERSL